jgi:hypothetical protein
MHLFLAHCGQNRAGDRRKQREEQENRCPISCGLLSTLSFLPADNRSIAGRSSAWIERTVRDREVASSNLVAPIFSPKGEKIEQWSGESSEESRNAVSRSAAVYYLLTFPHPPTARSTLLWSFLYFFSPGIDSPIRSVAALSTLASFPVRNFTSLLSPLNSDVAHGLQLRKTPRLSEGRRFRRSGFRHDRAIRSRLRLSRQSIASDDSWPRV